jgi:hypothetical protein
VGISQSDEDNPYANNTLNAVMRFNALDDFTLLSIEVYTDTPGDRRVLILDDSGVEVYGETFTLIEGMNKLDLNAEIPQGNGYRITTDGAVNMDQFAHEGPRLTRSSIDVFYPYTDDELILIEGSENGPNYYYFYNWEVEQLGTVCVSERYRYDVVVDFSESTSSVLSADQLQVYPNPADEFINITNTSGQIGKILITSLSGKVVFEDIVNGPTARINITSIPAGLYGFSFVTRYGVYSQLIVIAK